MMKLQTLYKNINQHLLSSKNSIPLTTVDRRHAERSLRFLCKFNKQSMSRL